MSQYDAALMKLMAEQGYYRSIFDVWVSSGRELTYSKELSAYFSVVAAPVMKELLPDEEEFLEILRREQERRMQAASAS